MAWGRVSHWHSNIGHAIEIQRKIVRLRVVGGGRGPPIDFFGFKLVCRPVADGEEFLPVDEDVDSIDAHAELPGSLFERQKFSSHGFFPAIEALFSGARAGGTRFPSDYSTQ